MCTRASLIIACASASHAFEHLTGLVAPTYSPLYPNGTVDLSGVDRQAAYLIKSNVSIVFPCGTTGESVDLTVAERKIISERWVKLGKFRVIVHVGADSVEDAKELAAHAAKLGAYAVAAMPPTFIRPKSVEALAATMGAIAAAAPELPFYYYHIPSATFVDFKMEAFLKAADGNIPNLAGIKYTHYDLLDLQMILHFKAGKYNILFGRDQFLLGAVALGVKGAVGSTYNFLGGTMQAVLGAFDRGSSSDALEVARATQLSTAMLIEVIDGWAAAWPGMYSLKAMEELTAARVGPPRLPYLPLTDPARADLKKRVVGWCATLPTAAVVPDWCGNLLW